MSGFFSSDIKHLAETYQKPICYMANSVHLKTLRIDSERNDTSLIKSRFKRIQANAAYLPHEKLDKLTETITTSPDELSNEIVLLDSEFPLKICGGC